MYVIYVHPRTYSIYYHDIYLLAIFPVYLYIYNIIYALGDIDIDNINIKIIILLNVSVYITEIQAAHIGLYTTAEWFWKFQPPFSK